MKLLVVDLRNPNKTKYLNPKKAGTWMWGRSPSSHKLFTVDGEGNITQILLKDSEVKTIQTAVDKALSS